MNTPTPTSYYICTACGYRAFYLGFRWGHVEVEIVGQPGRKTERQGLICPRCKDTHVVVQVDEGAGI